MTVSGLEFSFSSPVPENLRHDASQGTSMILSDKKEGKQDGLSLNNSNLEFQGEEEEVNESDDNIADRIRQDLEEEKLLLHKQKMEEWVKNNAPW